MAIKNAIYKVDNGAGYDEIWFKTGADQVEFTDGQTFQEKLDSGSLKGSKGDTGLTGNTWRPSVDAEGQLTWSQNSGSTTPAEVNIKGPEGAKGDKGDTGLAGATWKPVVNGEGKISWSQDSSATAPTEMDITGPKGDKGDKGDRGDAGMDATPHVFSATPPAGNLKDRVWVQFTD